MAVRRTAHRRKSVSAPGSLRRQVEVAIAAAGVNIGGIAVSGFWPIGDEIDIRTTLAALEANGAICALPCVVRKGEPLLFRAWRQGDDLVEAGFGTHEPAPSAAEVRPDIVLAPLLAVDELGWRLGYGGGYYDRTLRRLRDEKPVLAVGVGYDEQVVAAVPHEDYDERLEWIATDARVIRCGG